MVRIGTLVLIVHDAVDYWLEVSFKEKLEDGSVLCGAMRGLLKACSHILTPTPTPTPKFGPSWPNRGLCY